MSHLDVPEGTRSGTMLVVIGLTICAGFVVFLVFISPTLQSRMGLGDDAVGFPVPDAPRSEALLLGDEVVGEATWDASGVCAEISPAGRDAAGETFRLCADPEPLEPVWALDAPDEADPGYLLLAVAPDVGSIRGTTTDGEPLEGTTQTSLPAGWIVVALPDGAVVDRFDVFAALDDDDLGTVDCTAADAPTDGPDRLAGGCLIPSEE